MKITFLATLLSLFALIQCENRSPKNTFTPSAATNQPLSVLKNKDSAQVLIIPNFKSNFVDSRQVEIWLPAGYPVKDTAYQVLYMHDGQNVFDANTSNYGTAWEIDKKIDSLSRAGAILPTIVVASWCHPKKRFNEYMPQQPAALLESAFAKAELKEATGYDALYSNNYLKFITRELKPYIDDTFATDRQKNIIMGSSMGGLISSYAFMEYPDVFKHAGCLSTHWIVPKLGEAYINSLGKSIPDPKGRKIYFDYGTTGLDTTYEPHQKRVDSIFKDKGFDSSNYLSLKFDGHDHNEGYWQSRVAQPLVFLLN
jgi:predicted alpha/beta superfamily hydrolase